MLAIGLTGGIGSGKTEISNLFLSLGITVIDADQVARWVIENHPQAKKAIQEQFGDRFFKNDSLQRDRLRQYVFENPAQRIWLENLLHPLIRQEMALSIEKVQSAYCILAIPLLVEKLPNPLVNRILVVDTPIHEQIKRTVTRDDLDHNLATQIIKTQALREYRLALADDIISNYTDLNSLKRQVAILHNRYLSLTTLFIQK